MTDELHQLRAELAMTAALVACKAQERRRRSVSRRGGEATPLQHIRAVTPRTRVPLSTAAGDRRLVDLAARFSAPLKKKPRWPPRDQLSSRA
jgi:hypothetical protein